MFCEWIMDNDNLLAFLHLGRGRGHYPEAVYPLRDFCLPRNLVRKQWKISMTKEICITTDPPMKKFLEESRSCRGSDVVSESSVRVQWSWSGSITVLMFTSEQKSRQLPHHSYCLSVTLKHSHHFPSELTMNS